MPPVACHACPLRRLPLFVPFDPSEVAFMDGFKEGEVVAEPGATILLEGSRNPQLFTVLRGQGMRTKTLPDGRRQVVTFLFPGDFVGLQSGLLGETRHSVEARTAMTLCAFSRARLWELFRNAPERAYDLTWIAAVEEHFLGETIASLGQRDAPARIAWALLRIWQRLRAVGLSADGRGAGGLGAGELGAGELGAGELGAGGAVPFPFRQQDLADALGLSLVHTNKTLARLRARGVADWANGDLVVRDAAELARLALTDLAPPDRRPLM